MIESSSERMNLFTDSVLNEIAKFGFKYIKSRRSFVRKVNGNEHIYTFDVWDGFYMIEPALEILIKDVENIKKRAWGKSYSRYLSVGELKAVLVDNPEYGTIRTAHTSEVIRAAKGEVQFIENIALDYFDRMSDVSYLDRILNTTPGSKPNIAHNRIHSSFLAIIAAQLNNASAKRLESLIEFYRPVVIEYNDAYTEEYEILADYLMKINQNAI